jgi:hypothetical protein
VPSLVRSVKRAWKWLATKSISPNGLFNASKVNVDDDDVHPDRFHF